jgi:hypothetical protein
MAKAVANTMRLSSPVFPGVEHASELTVRIFKDNMVTSCGVDRH